jgi:CPA2 family monovalent cation:H+ antiporter-2
MEPNPLLYRDLVFIFLAATGGGLLAWRLKLPVILGFVLGGIVISPFTPGIKLTDLHTFSVLAEAGVVLLMFSIGVEFSIEDLKRVKWVAIFGGAMGIAMSIGLGLALARLAGRTGIQGVVVGAAVSVASTMVLARLLAERDEMDTVYGRVKIGITLFEDLGVVLMTVVLPAFGAKEADPLKQAGIVLGKAVVLIVPLAWLAMKVIPWFIRRVKKLDNPELMLLMVLSICLGTAWLAHELGFSVALGAFIAGLAISGSKDIHDAHDKLIPLRDAFVALFFVSLGAMIHPDIIRENLRLLGVMLLMIIPGKLVIWMIVMLVFRYNIWAALAVAVGLTQIGELSFVLVQTASDVHLVGEDVFNATLAASLISIFINVFLVRGVMAWVGPKLKEKPKTSAGDAVVSQAAH